MANEYLISVGVKADFTQLTEQQKVAAEAVKSATAQMEEAYKELASALGSSDQHIVAQAQAMMAEYQAAVDSAKASLAQATMALREFSAAQRSNVSATAEETDAITENTGATLSNAEAKRQAVDAGRVFMGSTYGAARAMADFASQFPAMQGVIAAAFDVAVVGAFVQMALMAGRAIYKFASNAEDLASELNTSWLEGAIGQMTGLAAATKQADDEALKLAQDADKFATQHQNVEAQYIGATQGQPAEDRYRASMEKQFAAKQAAMLGPLEDSLSADQKAAKATEPILANTGYGFIQVGTRLTPQAELAKKKVANDQEQIAQIQGNIADANMKAAVDLINATKAARTTSGTVTASGAAAPFSGMTAHELLFGTPAPHSVIWDEQQRAARSRAATLDRRVPLTGLLNPAAHVHTGLPPVESSSSLSSLRIIQFRERMGQLSPAQAAAQESAAVNANANSKISGLRATQNQVAPEGVFSTSQKQFAEYQQLQNKIVQVRLQTVAKLQQISMQEQMQNQQHYQRMFQNMTGPLNQFTDHWLQSGLRMGVAFQRMYDQLAMMAINYELKTVEAHIAAELRKTLATEEGNLKRVASTLMAEARTAAIETAHAFGTIAKFAAIGAAKAWTAMADIPVIGPALGVAAGAAAFAGIMHLAGAFEKGGLVPGSIGSAVPILAHGGEAVLPQSLTSMLTNAANNGAGGGAVHYHDHTNLSGIDGASVAGMYRKNAAAGRREFTRQLRLMNKI